LPREPAVNETFKDLADSFKSDSIEWCKGRNWIVRLPFLVFFIFLLIRHLADPMYYDILGPLNLGIHELGHLVFSFFGEFISVLGGTLLELGIPIFAIFNFYRQKDFFSVALSFGWVSVSLFGIARYVQDAQVMELPLISIFGGEDVIHDWNYMLSRLNILRFNDTVSIIIIICAVFSMFICLIYGAWLLRQMSRNRKTF
jgi:hypothetical protein